MTTIVNATPHPINVVNTNGEIITFPPSGILPRVEVTQTEVRGKLFDTLGNKFAVANRVQGQVTGLPDQEFGTMYIVSSMVASALKNKREDLIVPDTGASAIRDEKGNIVAVQGFVVEA